MEDKKGCQSLHILPTSGDSDRLDKGCLNTGEVSSSYLQHSGVTAIHSGLSRILWMTEREELESFELR